MLNRIRNVFTRLVEREHANDTRLGCPSVDGPARLRRVNAMSAMRSGNGFRAPKKGPKLSKGGTTRVQREAHLKEIYAKNLKAEADFRASAAGKSGWGIAQINRAIERREHLAVSA